MKKNYVIPGLHDSHAHPTSLGALAFRVRVSGSHISSIQSAVKEFAASHPSQEWIIGRGWDASGFAEPPTRHHLDAVDSKRPILLFDSDGHQLWANSKAIELAHVTADTEDPAGGTILREPDGSASGLFLETATTLVWSVVPAPSAEERKKIILNGDIAGVHSGFTAFSGGPISLDMARSYVELENEGKLKQRAYLWGPANASEEEFNKWVSWDRQRRKEVPHSRVKLSAFKLFVDGVVSSYTAALVEPYADHPELSGSANYTQQELNALVFRANALGYPVAMHAIGDRAVRMALNAVEESIRILGPQVKTLKNRIEHIELVHPADIGRFAKLGVLASMQPSHYRFGSNAESYYIPRLGTERAGYTFAWHSLLNAGATLAFGTDAPVVDQDPIEGFFGAIRRLHYNNEPYYLDQRISAVEALKGFTVNAAYAVSQGTSLSAVSVGELKAGDWADLTFFRKNPLSAEFTSLPENPVTAIMINGVFQELK